MGIGGVLQKLDDFVTDTTNAVFQALVGQGHDLSKFDGAKVDPSKATSRWEVVTCSVGVKNGKTDAHEVWARGLIDYQQKKSDTSPVVIKMAALGINLEEVLNDGDAFMDDQQRLGQAVFAKGMPQLAIEIDPTNIAVQRKTAELMIQKGDHRKAKLHLLQAITYEKDPEGFARTVAVAQSVKDPEIGNGWDFVIARLVKESRLEEAAAVSELGYGNAHYSPIPGGSPSSKVYQALLKADVTPRDMNGGQGPVTVSQPWSYVGWHFKDEKVQQALKAAGVPMPWLDDKGALRPEYADQDKIDFGNLLGDLYFSHQDYEKALAVYRSVATNGSSEAAYLGMGSSLFMMGDLPAAHDAYSTYLQFDSRSEKVRTARLEVNLMSLVSGEEPSEEVQFEILQDQAMLRFLSHDSDRAEMRRLTENLLTNSDPAELEAKAQEFLILGGLQHGRTEDTEELGAHYASLAAEAYLNLHLWASQSTNPATQEMATVYLADSYIAEGKDEEAKETYQLLIDRAAPRFVYGNEYIGETEVEKGKNALDRIIGKKQGEEMVAQGRTLIEEGRQVGDQSKILKGERLVADGEYKIKICHPYTEEPSPAVIEAITKLDAINNKKSRAFNLAALDFWEGIIAEQEKTGKTEVELEWESNLDGAQYKRQFTFNTTRERRLIAAIRESYASPDGPVFLWQAIKEIAASHTDEDLRKYADEYVHSPPNLIGYLMGYVNSGFPPRKDRANDLLESAYILDKGGYGAAAVGAYQFVAAFSPEKDIQDKAEKRIRLATGNGGFWETVDDIGNRVIGETPDEIARNLGRDVLIFGAIGKVGTVARLAMARRLQKSGQSALKVWLYSHAAEVVVTGTGFFLDGTRRELENGDPDKVLSPGHLARRWGASVLLMGLGKAGGGAQSFAGKNEVVRWAVGHLGSFAGMASAGYAGRAVGLEDGSLANWGPLASAIVLYPAYAGGGALMHTPPAARNPVSLRAVSEARLFFGLEGEITPQTAKQAYRNFAKKHHPDSNGGRGANHALLTRANTYRAILLKGAGVKLANDQEALVNDYIANLMSEAPTSPERGDRQEGATPLRIKRPARSNWRYQAGAILVRRGNNRLTPKGDTPAPILKIPGRGEFRFEAGESEVVFGRGDWARGLGSDTQISARHFTIRRRWDKQNGVFVNEIMDGSFRDGEYSPSTNGTFMKGVKLPPKKWWILTDGTTIRTGKTEITFGSRGNNLPAVSGEIEGRNPSGLLAERPGDPAKKVMVDTPEASVQPSPISWNSPSPSPEAGTNPGGKRSTPPVQEGAEALRAAREEAIDPYKTRLAMLKKRAVNEGIVEGKMLVMAREIKGLWIELVDLQKKIDRIGGKLNDETVPQARKETLRREQSKMTAQMDKYAEQLDTQVKQFRSSEPREVDSNLWTQWVETYGTLEQMENAAEVGLSKIESGVRFPWVSSKPVQGEPITAVRDQISFMSSGHMSEFEIADALFGGKYEGKGGPIVAGLLKIDVRAGADIPEVADAVIKTAENNGASGDIPRYLPEESLIGPDGAVLVFGNSLYADIRYEVRINR